MGWEDSKNCNSAKNLLHADKNISGFPSFSSGMDSRLEIELSFVYFYVNLPVSLATVLSGKSVLFPTRIIIHSVSL